MEYARALLVTAARWDAAEQPSPAAAVPAEPVQLDPVSRRRAGAHMQVDRVAGLDADLGGVALQGMLVLGRQSLLGRSPGRRPGERVLGLNRIAGRACRFRDAAAGDEQRADGESEGGHGLAPRLPGAGTEQAATHQGNAARSPAAELFPNRSRSTSTNHSKRHS